MPNIFHRIDINAGRQAVYEAITTREGQSKWWIVNCEVRPEIGYVNILHITDAWANYMRVVDLQPDRRVEWLCLNENDEWSGTQIIFEIAEQNNLCFLNFHHNGFRAETEFMATCSYHWARHLWILKHLCETGESILDKDQEREEVRKVKGI